MTSLIKQRRNHTKTIILQHFTVVKYREVSKVSTPRKRGEVEVAKKISRG